MPGNVVRWDPFGDFRRMSRSFERPFPFASEPSEVGDLPLAFDVFEKDGQLVLSTPVPGAKPDEVKVNVQDDIVTVSAETKGEQDVKEGDWHRREVRWGRSTRSFRLPQDVDREAAKATFENGVLKLAFPKTTPKPKSMSIPIAVK